MRLTEFVVVVVAALLFLIPTMRNENRPMERQEQEEAPMEQILENESHTYKVIFEVKTPDEEGIADIIWMKKAAEIAKDQGIPYFNVLEQHTTSRFVESANMELSVVEGVIQLDKDPMRAEFDANEIESLVLTDSP